jgi:hypothetical protein
MTEIIYTVVGTIEIRTEGNSPNECDEQFKNQINVIQALTDNSEIQFIGRMENITNEHWPIEDDLNNG